MRVRVAAAVVLLAWWAANSAPSNDFRFSILGDRTGEAQPGVYEQVWKEVDRLHPDFVINVGDVIQGGNDATMDQEWRSVQAVWQRYRYPLYFTPGNHDVWSTGSAKTYEKVTGRPLSYAFDYQGAHFTVLDNSRTDNLSDDQMKFLEQDLAAHRDRNPKFVFFHRPNVWLIPLKFQSDFPLHHVLREYHVTAVFSGHTHQFVHLEKDGIEYVCVGSSGGHLRGTGFAAGWFYQHVFAVIKGSGVDLTVKEIDPPLGEGRTVHIKTGSSRVIVAAPARLPPLLAHSKCASQISASVTPLLK